MLSAAETGLEKGSPPGQSPGQHLMPGDGSSMGLVKNIGNRPDAQEAYRFQVLNPSNVLFPHINPDFSELNKTFNNGGGFVTSVNFFRRQGCNVPGNPDASSLSLPRTGLAKTAKGADNKEATGRGLHLVQGGIAQRTQGQQIAAKNLNLNLQLGLDKLKEAKNKRYQNDKVLDAAQMVATTLQSKSLHSR